jgi:cytoskeletal protein CcmA (bactofilin family)
MSIVSRGLTIEGNLSGDDDIRVDGTVNGDIHSRTLIVSQGAKVSGSVTAEMIELLGHIGGELNGKTVRIAGTGHLDGDVNYDSLSIEAGAVVNGQLRHGSAKQTRGAATGTVAAKTGNGAAKPDEPKTDTKSDAKGDAKPDAKPANA